MADPTEWSNERILKEIFTDILRDIYDRAARSDFRETLREAMNDESPVQLRDLLVNIQSIPIVGFLTYIDGAVGPTDMPRVALVREDTGESLSVELAGNFAEAESDVIDEVEPPMPPDDHTLYFYRE